MIQRIWDAVLLRCQRVTCLTGIGCLLIIGSHFSTDEKEREWLRESGAAVIAFGVTKWMASQGKRRNERDGGQRGEAPEEDAPK